MTMAKPQPRLRFAMVCASNQNRSMEAHALLQREGFEVESFGVGAHVKLPGSSAKEPNVYPFGTPYQAMHDDLLRKDPELYTRNGLLRMLERNISVKRAPQRWQDSREEFDVVVTFEERVMDQVLEDLHARPLTVMRPVLVINLDVKDSHEEAAMAAPHALDLCTLLDQASRGQQHLQMPAGVQGEAAAAAAAAAVAAGKAAAAAAAAAASPQGEAAAAAAAAGTDAAEQLGRGGGGEQGDEGPDWCVLDALLDGFEKRTGRRAVYSICWQ